MSPQKCYPHSVINIDTDTETLCSIHSRLCVILITFLPIKKQLHVCMCMHVFQG